MNFETFDNHVCGSGCGFSKRFMRLCRLITLLSKMSVGNNMGGLLPAPLQISGKLHAARNQHHNRLQLLL